MKRIIIALSVLTVGVLFCLSPQVVTAANQPPHVPENGVNCDSCHLPATDPVWAVGNDPDPDQNDPINRICWKCHDDTTAVFKKTHSSTAVGSTKYGDWRWNCVACHNPHQQTQTNFNTYIASLSGAISAINAGTKTFTLNISLPERSGVGTAGPDNDYVGWTIVPNKTYKTVNYKISANTASTVTVTTAIATTRVAVGSLFGILPGRYVKDIVTTPGGAKYTRLFALEGPNSFVNNDGLAGGQDSTPDGICQICHGIRAEGAAMSRSRADGTGFGDGHPTDASANCEACHDHAQIGFGGGGCNGCHGYPPDSSATLVFKDKNGTSVTSDSPGAGAHVKHIAANLNCTNCHTGGMLAGAAAGDNKINIGFYLSTNLGGNYDGKTGRTTYPYLGGGTTTVSAGNSLNCTTVYCHSTGQGNTAGNATPTYATPSWNTPSSGACGTCHKVTAASGLTSGSHAQHLNSAVTIGCGDCHTGAANDASSYSSANHVNKNIDVANSYTAGGAPGNGYGQCNNQACHGGDGTSAKSPVWGNPTAKAGCYRCHGDSANGNAAPAPDNMGDTATNDPQVGAHQTHLKGSNNYSSVIACSECHTVPANVEAAGHINDGTPGVAEVPLAGTLATTNPNSVPGSPSYSAGQCSNVYCHDSSRFKNGWAGGTGHTPTWSNDAYLGIDKAVNCGACHGNPPGGSHPAVAANNCSGCHSNVNVAGDGFVDKALHVNGIIEPVAGCTGCHDANGTTLPGKHGVHYASATDASAHSTATNDSTAGAYIFQCGNCHNNETNHMGTVSFAAVSFNVAWAPVTTGTYTPNTGNGNDATDSKGVPISTDGSCANLYCHSNGLGGAPNVAAVWNGAAMTCASCHSYDAAAVNKMSSGAHTAHMNDGTIMTNKGCQECHNATTTNGTSISDKTQHVDGQKDVAISATYDSDATPGNNWNSGTSTCSNVYCHSTGEATPTYKPVVWSATISDCKSCHNYDVASGTIMATGSHTEHVNNAAVIATNYGCQECHNSTTTNGTSITTPANHVNKTRDVSIVKGGSWNGTDTCSSVYCHSDGQPAASRIYATVPVWGSATDLGCNACHGTGNALGRPDYANGGAGTATANSHTAHASVSADCANCHTDTTSNGTAIKAGSALHTNQTENVNFAAAFDNNGGTNADNYNSGTKTCSAITCHGAGAPVWGSAALPCNDCHGANNTMQGAHDKHYGTATIATNRNDSRTASGTAYIFNCGVCHNATSHGTGNVSAIQAANVSFGAINAISGTYTADTVLAGTDTGGRPWTNGTCTVTYCHSQGTTTTSPFGGAGNTVARWNGAAMTCEGCHNYDAAATNKMSSGDHTPHMNKNNVIANIACSACHTSTTSDGTTITNEDMHVNKVKDVTIAATYDSDATPGNNWAAGQCSNVYCHSTGQSTPTYYTETWGSGAADCVFCHGGANGALGNSGAGASLTASHTEHTGTFSYTCNVCHETVAQNNTTILGAGLSKHVDKNRQVAVSATYGGTGTEGGDFISGSCSTTNCHGSTSPAWTAGATTGNCSACHGMAASAADGRDTGGNTNPAIRPLGVHVAHLTAASNYSSPVACGECHKTTVDNMAAQVTYMNKVNATGHIDSSLPAELTWGSLATTGSSVPGWDSGTGTCSTNYCHGNKQTGGTDKAPEWNQTGYLTGTPNAAGDCGICHGAPPQTSSHQKSAGPPPVYYALTECNGCHSHFKADATGFSDASKHINGTVDGGGCSGCHSYDVDYSLSGGFDGTKWTGGDWGKGAYRDGLNPGQGWGAHAKHINHIKTRSGYNTTSKILAEAAFGTGDAAAICGTCHTNTATNHTTDNSSGRVINFGDGTYKEGGASGFSFLFDPSATSGLPTGLPRPTYNGASGTSSSVSPKSCSAVGCHFTTSPVWSSY